ncbi:hypothetical protein G6045_08170 [Streptomyces sp. YC504]|uniref:Zinc finger CGNR domain-containing protein n=1 Tax=Streptomyces mesophilus TaxID=1775132 RepID=A0A6G4XDP3_9ACTN|nr:hypothetical protein [Streptomyces mesophilus]
MGPGADYPDVVQKVTTGPQLGEPLPIELANATYAVRGRPQDGLRMVEQLALWLEGVNDRLPVPLSTSVLRSVDEADLERARELRESVRAIAACAVRGARPPQAALDMLNERAAEAPCWRELRWEKSPASSLQHDGPPVTAVLASIAQGAVDLFAGPGLDDLRACQGPGCVLFFVKDHPRREWCSAACGNRARAARHYARVREQKA